MVSNMSFAEGASEPDRAGHRLDAGETALLLQIQNPLSDLLHEKRDE